MSGEFAYDVFLSYSQADAKWVRGELLPRLERAGLKVCIDYRDFAAGAPKPTETERAITSSRKTVLVLTATYLTDGRDEFENLLLQTLDPASCKRRLSVAGGGCAALPGPSRVRCRGSGNGP